MAERVLWSYGTRVADRHRVGPRRLLFDVGGLLVALEELLGCEVDVICAGGLKPDKYVGHRGILAEAIRL